MNALLVANYLPDRQESMLRFAELLERELPARNVPAHCIRPAPHFNIRAGATGMDKYLGYVDKLALFPRRLRRSIEQNGAGSIVHICDHSNAFYTAHLKDTPHVVTCHDLLAVRSALGEFAHHRTGWTGRRLQGMILGGLRQARRVCCVSEATRQDVLRLTSLPPSKVDVVYNGLNYPYSRMPAAEREPLLARFNLQLPFILHVGGDHWYKNRQGVLEIYAAVRERIGSPPSLVFAGPALSPQQRGFAVSRGFERDIRVVSHLSNEELRALYSSAEMLLFPSWVEGFGWPIIEAQACGCRVVTSNSAPMTEVGGPAAVYIAPGAIEASAEAVTSVLTETSGSAAERVRSLIANAARFSTDRMISSYCGIYARELGLSAPAERKSFCADAACATMAQAKEA